MAVVEFTIGGLNKECNDVEERVVYGEKECR